VRPRNHPNGQSPGPGTQKPAYLRRLRDSASHAVLGGRYRDALGYCRQLEEVEPDDPAWARRTAYCCHRLGMRASELAALLRAAEGYERSGFMRKAVAMYRLAVALDPTDKYLSHRITDLTAGQGTGLQSLQPPGALAYFTQSEAPPSVVASPEHAGQTATAARPASAPSLAAGQVADDAARLVDEYALIEFTETEVIPDD
jgi:tetratricopeptide (TPR) repeat protein